MYSRDLDGMTLTLEASGWVYQTLFVLHDRETGSLWWGAASQSGNDDLICVAGPLADRRLPRVPFMRTVWWYWLDQHPDTKLARPN